MNINKIILNYQLDAVLVTSLVNIRYLSGFTGSEARLLISNNKKFILVDSRYIEQAQKQCCEFIVVLIDHTGFINTLTNLIKENEFVNIGFEENNIVVYDYNQLNNILDCNFIGVSLNEIRMIKSTEEVNLIKKACEITDKAYTHILNFVKIGMSEHDVNIELQKFILDYGCSGLSFDTIVASGQRGSMPHGVASDKIIEDGDFITLDFGVFYHGYASDMTRTFVIGQNPNKKLIEIYNIVLEAQLAAIRTIKPGIIANEVDKIAREYIKNAGYGAYFNHGLGHSIGLEIHELPNVSPTSFYELKPGHIITIEPGIYIPGLGGVRIEDDILVTDSGYEILNKSCKDLIKIDGR